MVALLDNLPELAFPFFSLFALAPALENAFTAICAALTLSPTCAHEFRFVGDFITVTFPAPDFVLSTLTRSRGIIVKLLCNITVEGVE